MFKQFLKVVEGADFYMITSLLIFFTFFLLVGLYLLLMKKNHVKYMSNLPLEDEPKMESSSDVNSKS
jgi:cbb3-type cytochrome oxidase subunit 3